MYGVGFEPGEEPDCDWGAAIGAVAGATVKRPGRKVVAEKAPKGSRRAVGPPRRLERPSTIWPQYLRAR